MKRGLINVEKVGNRRAIPFARPLVPDSSRRVDRVLGHSVYRPSRDHHHGQPTEINSLDEDERHPPAEPDDDLNLSEIDLAYWRRMTAEEMA